MKKIYLAIMAHLKTLDAFFEEFSYSKIKYYDLFRGQYIYPESHPAYDRPAVFIEMAIDWSDNQANLSQQGTATIRVHVVQDQYSDSFDYDAGASADKSTALRVLDFADLVHEAIHGFESQSIGKLYRTRSLPDTGADNEDVTILEYTCQIIDDSTSRLNEYVHNDPTDVALNITNALVKKIKGADTESKYQAP